MEPITNRPLQIGVFASADDSLPDAEWILGITRQSGEANAVSKNILVYWVELDSDSLSARAARWAYEAGWLTITVPYGNIEVIRERFIDIF